jgi:thiamine kinase-like enzyme
MLLQYLSGNTLRNNDFQRAGVVRKVAEACRRLHSGPRFRGRFDMFERQAGYLKTVQDNRFRMPSDYLDYQDKFRDVEKVLTAIDNADRAETVDRALVPCNNDLLAGNFVEDGDKVWMIDYEYSGNNDPCFELGNVWSECGLSSDQLDELVTAYYGRRLRHKIARARLQGIVAKYGWTLWGCIQNGSSSLEFDFWGWAMERYEAAVAEFNSPHFARLLDEAQTAD